MADDDEMFIFSREDVEEIRRVLKWIKNLRGDGVTNTPWGATVGQVQSRAGKSNDTRTDFVGHFAVTAAVQDGTNKRWAYSMAEHEKSAAAYDGWTAKSGGRTITAYNDQEEDNAATGLYGNGVLSTNLTGTLSVMPAPTAKGVHRVYSVTVLGATPATEYWFSHANAIDGGCT